MFGRRKAAQLWAAFFCAWTRRRTIRVCVRRETGTARRPAKAGRALLSLASYARCFAPIARYGAEPTVLAECGGTRRQAGTTAGHRFQPRHRVGSTESFVNEPRTARKRFRQSRRSNLRIAGSERVRPAVVSRLRRDATALRENHCNVRSRVDSVRNFTLCAHA